LLKISEMEENAYQLFQHELEVHEVMRVHREERVFPSIYPCSEFMNAAGILQDFQTLISNAGLEHFIDDEPPQYVKLTMSVVQDFRFSWSTSNPMVHYKMGKFATGHCNFLAFAKTHCSIVSLLGTITIL
jgi:hypothetical protein